MRPYNSVPMSQKPIWMLLLFLTLGFRRTIRKGGTVMSNLTYCIFDITVYDRFSRFHLFGSTVTLDEVSD